MVLGSLQFDNFYSGQIKSSVLYNVSHTRLSWESSNTVHPWALC